MLVFVDISGDSGRKILRNSSRYLIVALVAVEESIARDCNDRIDKLRSELGQPESFEFHFSHNSDQIRDAFLRALSPYPFRFYIPAIDKEPSGLAALGIRRNEDLARFLIRQTCVGARAILQNADVVIDGQKGEKRMRNELRSYLSNELTGENGERLVAQVRIRPSHRDNLLQLADYVAVASNRFLTRRTRSRDLVEHFLGNLRSLRILPD